jgi:hypothetical protein
MCSPLTRARVPDLQLVFTARRDWLATRAAHWLPWYLLPAVSVNRGLHRHRCEVRPLLIHDRGRLHKQGSSVTAVPAKFQHPFATRARKQTFRAACAIYRPRLDRPAWGHSARPIAPPATRTQVAKHGECALSYLCACPQAFCATVAWVSYPRLSATAPRSPPWRPGCATDPRPLAGLPAC